MGKLIRVRGLVQGIGFRPFIYRLATKNNLKGYVKNLGDGTVEIYIEGKEIAGFLREMKRAPLSEIEDMEIMDVSDIGYKDFVIEKSEEKGEEVPLVPPDIAICGNCLEEMYDESNRRFLYFFITCTHCGPRYTIIRKLPYDRENTTMNKFEMCIDCEKEYRDPLDRRYHAQTVACARCGPSIILIKDGKILRKGNDAIRFAGEELNRGKIVAIKGIGGFHLSVDANDNEAVLRLREIYNRPAQPFAVMVRDLKTAREIACIGELEEELLTSSARPIVVVRKKGEPLSKYIAPDLHTIGIMLPYTGLHYLLFDHFDGKALVMTSANEPGEPMIKDEEDIGKIKADYFLVHDREIYQRCDDSVIRVVNGKASFLRRSRGYVPLPIELDRDFKEDVLALGPEIDVTICLFTKRKAIPSQYIGNTSNYDTMKYLLDTLHHMKHLFNVEPSIIVCDLNPAFETSKLARELAEDVGGDLIEVQHHFAHAFSLIGEHRLNEMICIAIDGYGYGLDGNAWGGEIVYAGEEAKRLAHLEYFPLIGGDRATYYPLRIVAGILGRKAEDWLIERKDRFPYGGKEIDVVLKQRADILTSSCGRFLDGVSALLDICYYRSYEGEPAMKLESFASRGRDVIEIEPLIHGNEIKVKEIFEYFFENLGKYRREDMAYAAEKYIALSLAEIALEKAEEEGVKSIGISGGCAYNDFIVSEISRLIRERGFDFYQNERIPCGDGGVSFGQGIYYSFIELC